MCNLNKLINYILLCLLLSSQGFAQSRKLARADKYFRNFNCQKAIELYSEIAKCGYIESSSELVNPRLGKLYSIINDTKNAEIWYQAAVEMPKCDSMTYFYYSQVLRNNKKYDEASKWMYRYLLSNPNDKESIYEMASFRDYPILLADSNHISVEHMNLNNLMLDNNHTYLKSKIILLFSKDSKLESRGSWIDEPFYILYKNKTFPKFKEINYQRVFGDLCTKYHESLVTYDKNSNILYFTRNNFFNGKKGKSKDNANYLKIYQAINIEGKWQDIKELPFNSEEYSCAHPAISPDGLKLYFISGMSGGYGGTDIYYCDKQDSGWSKPINIGKPINTVGNELFPSFSDDGTFFFASTGHPGLGGMDIFSYANNKIVNLGYPINTSFDDFGLCTQNGEKGFFSSNRNGGLNNDDIYFFRINQPPVANNDKASIELKGSDEVYTININVLENDSDANLDIDSSTVQVIYQANRKASVQSGIEGIIAYLPEPGFKGIDTLQYVVFDKTHMSDTAYVFISVFGKNPPVAKLDTVVVQKNSKDNKISVLSNDFDRDGNMITDSIEVLSDPQNGTVEVVKGMIKYTPNKDFSGKDYLVYQIFDSDGLNDKDSLLIDVKMAFMGKVITKDLELSLTINFESGKWDILPQAALVLDSLVTILKQNSTLEIELGAHTDSRGSANANQVLSKKRAESAVAYIITKGIAANRLIAFGYGESEPVNKCKDGVPCTKEEYAINRRVTIKVLKY